MPVLIFTLTSARGGAETPFAKTAKSGKFVWENQQPEYPEPDNVSEKQRSLRACRYGLSLPVCAVVLALGGFSDCGRG